MIMPITKTTPTATATTNGNHHWPCARVPTLPRKWVCAALVSLSFLQAAPLPADASDSLRVHGSTTFFENVLRSNMEKIENMSGKQLDVMPSKSIWGLVDLLERRADLAMISANLEGEIEIMKKANPDLPFADLKVFEVAEVRISFPVHPSNPVRSLNNDQLRQIFCGAITNWKVVGGPDLPIRVVATQDGGGTVVTTRAQLLDGAAISAPNAIRPESARHVVQVVAQEPGAIGIAQLGLVKKAGLPEVSASKPISQVLSLVTLGTPAADIAAVIDAARTVASQSPL